MYYGLGSGWNERGIFCDVVGRRKWWGVGGELLGLESVELYVVRIFVGCCVIFFGGWVVFFGKILRLLLFLDYVLILG